MNFLTLLVLGPIALLCNCENFREICYDIKQFTNYSSLHRLYKIATSRTAEHIRRNGYPVENHTVTTEDGYILSMQRIPHGLIIDRKRDAHPILILHGVFTSSMPYTIGTNSLPYMLVNEGYDVWLGNFRSSFHDTRHVNYSQSDSKYWDFGLEELAEIDTPTFIEYILQTTNHTQVTIISMSMSTTTTTYMLAFNPELSKKVSRHVELAPTVYVGYMTFYLPYHQLMKLFKITGITDNMVFSLNKYLGSIVPITCSGLTAATPFCQKLLTILLGYSPGTYGFCIGGVWYTLFQGISTKILFHFYQLLINQQLMRYDYGLAENLARYDTREPPIANISQITTPTCIIYSANDPLGSPLNVALLAREMKMAKIVLLEDTMVNHLDFIAGALDDNITKRINHVVYECIQGV